VTTHGPRGALLRACDRPDEIADDLRAAGQRVVRVIGQDAPFALLRAAGLSPVRMIPGEDATRRADDLIGRNNALTPRGRSLLDQIMADESGDPLLITHADADCAQLFAMLRELLRSGRIADRPVHMFDGLHLRRPTTTAYNRRQIDRLRQWQVAIGGGAVDAAAFAREVMQQRRMAERIDALRGVTRVAAIGACCALPPDRALALQADAAGEDAPGERVFLLGSAQASSRAAQEMESRGLVLVGDDQDWGDPLLAAWLAMPEDVDRLAKAFGPVPRRLLAADARAADILDRIARLRVSLVLFDEAAGDEAAAWDRGYLERIVEQTGTAFAPLYPAPAIEHTQDNTRPPPPRRQGGRSRKTLQSLASFGAYQRQWFGEIRDQAKDGKSFAVVNANAPQEILRAMGIPFVVNQWWASIVAAKQQSGRYIDLLEAACYPRAAEAYSAQGLAALFDRDETAAPWGGLPVPGLLHAVQSTDATPRIFDHWAREAGADLFLYEHALDTRLDIPVAWWDLLPDQWDEVLQPERIDMMAGELSTVIARIEQTTPHRFDHAAFRTVMNLVNEQEEYYRKARDAIAQAPRAPISIVDSMPATMVPQWHRGTAWARDAARQFHDEVVRLIADGQAACPGERKRLMWIGRGLWSDLGFYQRWEESHGAVFVWSMYLALAADGYIRRFDRGRDPLRALAARFVTMGDELRMPSWAGPWHVREARTHRIDGAVALADADPFVLRALHEAGVPVLALDLDNYDLSEERSRDADAQITGFLETL
jgi:hypothetical protein